MKYKHFTVNDKLTRRETGRKIQKNTKRNIQDVWKKKDKKDTKRGGWKNTNGYEQRQVEKNGQTQRGTDEQK